MNAYNN